MKDKKKLDDTSKEIKADEATASNIKEGKAEAKAEAKPEAKPEAKAEAKSDIKADAKAETKPEAKSDVKAEAKPDTKTETDAKKDRTVHGHQIEPEEIKEKDKGPKFHSFKERVGYCWDYYKYTVGVAVVLGFIAFMLIRSVIIEMKPPIIYIAMMNAHMDSPGDATFGDDYGNERGLDPKSGRIVMDADFLHPMTVDDAALKNDTIIASMQRFTAAVTNSNIDVAITNPWVLMDYMENEIFYNLEEIYSEEEQKELESLFWYETDSTGRLVPVGVIVNGHRNVDTFYDEGTVIVIGIPRDSKRVERAKDFVAWMLEE